MKKKTVIIGLLGSNLDRGEGAQRWEHWRPTVVLGQHEDFLIHRFEILHEQKYLGLAQQVVADLQSVSPETRVQLHLVSFKDAWDFEEVYATLHDFARRYPFEPDREDYLVHITTGSHVQQISLFLLTEARYFPARLIQTSPPKRKREGAGTFRVIDLDLSKYDQLASRFAREQHEGLSFLKSGIDTKNPAFNALIAQIERVAINSREPILLLGPTGSGKSQLARKIYELKRARRQVNGDLVDVNCATLRGDLAMSTLFSHVKGAFTGATRDRPGHLRLADQGVLFLDEIGELGRDEQAMLLRALEEKRFLPVGADKEVRSDFQLIAGTNRHLKKEVQTGNFREDLFARINLWTFRLPSLQERREDVEPNLNYELAQFSKTHGRQATFSKEARELFLHFAVSSKATWNANFRDFNAAITRMATLAPGGRITVEIVKDEIERLQAVWQAEPATEDGDEQILPALPGNEKSRKMDRFDQIQLAGVIKICRQCKNISAAGRELFAVSRQRKQNTNDADRLRKYLARFGLAWQEVSE
ncbi:RNA repair transcriptional activator RtcR [candidate division KSB1 bacterium]|nr:RNA repair transcriptional activator RtcR [candidate division KSB1 bacterium]